MHQDVTAHIDKLVTMLMRERSENSRGAPLDEWKRRLTELAELAAQRAKG